MATDRSAVTTGYAHPSRQDENAASAAIVAAIVTVVFAAVFAPLLKFGLSIVGFDAVALWMILAVSAILGAAASLIRHRLSSR